MTQAQSKHAFCVTDRYKLQQQFGVVIPRSGCAFAVPRFQRARSSRATRNPS
jgi:hypothetical protein